MNYGLRILGIYIVGMLFWSCEKSDPIIPNEEELITTVEFTLVPDSGNTVILQFKDLDGDGGLPAEVTSGTLQKNMKYTGSLSLLNESTSPIEDISEEVKEEGEEHQFFFTIDSGLDMTVNYLDQDAGGKPVGLDTEIVTGQASSGIITVTLRHEPNKSAVGVEAGELGNAGGETDIEVDFQVNIE